MRKYSETTPYWKNKEYSQKECKEITRKHRKKVMEIMNIFCRKVKNLWKNHDKDKEIPENLELYTYLLNHPHEEEINNVRKRIHNHNNTHHVEWFLAHDKPKLQHLVEMVCDHVAAALARNAEYEDVYEENKQRYMKKWLPEPDHGGRC